MDPWNPVMDGQVGEKTAHNKKWEASTKDQQGLAIARECCELGLKATVTHPRNDRQSKPKRTGCGLRLAHFNVVCKLVGRIGNKSNNVCGRDQFPSNFNSLSCQVRIKNGHSRKIAPKL